MNTEKFNIKYPTLYYINLKNRTERKKHILQELNKINYPSNKIVRIDAVKHNNGLTGCALSHIKAIKLAIKNNDDYAIIMEDDFTWKYDSNTTNKILNKCFNFKEDWNVILLSKNGEVKQYNDFLDKVIQSQTASGYIIKKKYIPTLLKLWEENVSIRLKYNISKKNPYKNYTNHNTALDICWKKLQGDKWFSTNPILGYQMESYSDIEKKVVDYNV